MRSVFWATVSLALAVPVALNGLPVAAAERSMVPNTDADKLVATFFDLAKAGKTGEAVDGLFKTSPLMSSRVAEKQQLVAQANTAIQIYGPIRSAELVESSALGSLFVKRYYLVQHANMLTRWEFDFAKLPTGWTTVYFGFNDQAPTWI